MPAQETSKAANVADHGPGDPPGSDNALCAFMRLVEMGNQEIAAAEFISEEMFLQHNIYQ